MRAQSHLLAGGYVSARLFRALPPTVSLPKFLSIPCFLLPPPMILPFSTSSSIPWSPRKRRQGMGSSVFDSIGMYRWSEVHLGKTSKDNSGSAVRSSAKMRDNAPSAANRFFAGRLCIGRAGRARNLSHVARVESFIESNAEFAMQFFLRATDTVTLVSLLLPTFRESIRDSELRFIGTVER